MLMKVVACNLYHFLISRVLIWATITKTGFTKQSIPFLVNDSNSLRQSSLSKSSPWLNDIDGECFPHLIAKRSGQNNQQLLGFLDYWIEFGF